MTDPCPPTISPEPPLVPVTEEPPGVPGLECPEGTVPGWLNENGEPTSCVGDSPQPIPEQPVPSSPPVPHLAETGFDVGLFSLATGVIALGVLFVLAARSFRRD
jgi:hypothetical protein